jgi:hypothetical protein
VLFSLLSSFFRSCDDAAGVAYCVLRLAFAMLEYSVGVRTAAEHIFDHRHGV